MVPNQRLTKRSVEAVAPPSKGDAFVWDTELKGFGVRVTSAGVRSYVLQYRLRGQAARRITLGRHGSPWTTELARREAERRLIEVRQGVDPAEQAKRNAAEKRRAEQEAQLLSFERYMDRFVELYLKPNWRTWRAGENALRPAKRAFAGRTIRDVSRADVAGFLDGYTDRPGAKKLLHSLLRKLFNWAADRGDLTVSPIASMKAPKTIPARRRVLTPEELVAIWCATEKMGGFWRPLVRLLILTLQRRDEVASLDWSEIELASAVWDLPSERTKNGQPHRVPLSDLAIEELRKLEPKRAGLLFSTTGSTAVSGFTKAKRKLDELALAELRKRAERRGEDGATISLQPWRLHDLRRTGATNLQALGIPVEVTEAVLNHVSGTTGGIAGVYNRYRYDAEKEAALTAWAAHLSKLVSVSEAAR